MSDPKGDYPPPLVLDGREYARWKELRPFEKEQLTVGSVRFFLWSSAISVYLGLISFGYFSTFVERPITASFILGAGMGLPLVGGLIFTLVLSLRKQGLSPGASQKLARPGNIPSEAISVRVTVAYTDKSSYGRDEGWLWPDEGRLHFAGQRCRFWIGESDFKKAHGLEKAFGVQTRSYLLHPKGLPQALQIRWGAELDRHEKAKQLERLLNLVRSQPQSSRPSRFPPIELGHEPIPVLEVVKNLLPLALAGLPLSGFLLWFSYIAPDGIAAGLARWEMLLVLPFFLPGLIALAVLGQAGTDASVRSSLRKAMARQKTT